MKNNNIYFTNLGIIKCKEFELTYRSFYDKMSRLICNDPSCYQIVYDEEENEYKVIYNSNTYFVKFGRDGFCEKHEAVELLDKLIKIQSNSQKMKKEENDKKENDERKRKALLDRVRKGILETKEEKEMKIANLKEQHKDKKFHLWKSVWKFFKSMNYGDVWEYHDNASMAVGMAFIIPILVFGALGNNLLAVIFFALFVIFLVDSATVSISSIYGGYKGLIKSILSILALPFNVLYNVLRKVIDEVGHQKEIHDIKKTIDNLEGKDDFIPKSKINIKEVYEFINQLSDKAFNKDNVNLDTIYKNVIELKNNIILIKDSRKRNKFAQELYEIIEYYVDANNYIKDKDNVSKIFYTGINDLTKRVSDELNKEKEVEETKNDYDTLMDTISNQKSIGAR